MKTVHLIQFTEHTNQDYGKEPELFKWYRVVDLYSDYYYETEDDDGDTVEEHLDSIQIIWGYRETPNGRRRPNVNHVINDDGTKFKLMTIELDNNSELFL